MSEKSYSLFGTYSQSKLANVLFTFQMQKVLEAKGSKVSPCKLHNAFLCFESSKSIVKQGTNLLFFAPLQYPCSASLLSRTYTYICTCTYTCHSKLRVIVAQVTCNAVHPGCVRTEVTRHMNAFMRMGDTLGAPIMKTLQKTPAEGAYCSIYAATAPELEGKGGLYLFHCQAVKPGAAALRADDAEQLWKKSETLTGAKGLG